MTIISTRIPKIVPALCTAVIFIVAIGITVFNVKEESTIGVYAEKTSLKQAFRIIIKNDQLLAFIGILLTYQTGHFSNNGKSKNRI